MVNPIELRFGKFERRTKFCTRCRTEYIVNEATIEYHKTCTLYYITQEKRKRHNRYLERRKND